jgi:hypothetical protein
LGEDSALVNSHHTEKPDEKNKKIELSSNVGYLSQLRKEKEKEIKKLEEKIKPKRPSKTKIYITSKDKKKNYDNPSEIKLGRIYTTLNQNPPKPKQKAKSVQKVKIINQNNNTLKEQNFTNIDDNNKIEYDIDNLFQKKMKFDSQIKEIKEFLKK